MHSSELNGSSDSTRFHGGSIPPSVIFSERRDESNPNLRLPALIGWLRSEKLMRFPGGYSKGPQKLFRQFIVGAYDNERDRPESLEGATALKTLWPSFYSEISALFYDVR